MSAAEPLLRVEDLRVEFPTEDGLVHAVDGITYQVHRGQARSGSSASRAPARPSPR